MPFNEKRSEQRQTEKKMMRVADRVSLNINVLLDKVLSELDVDATGGIENTVKNNTLLAKFQIDANESFDAHNAVMGDFLSEGRVDEARAAITDAIDNIAAGNPVE